MLRVHGGLSNTVIDANLTKMKEIRAFLATPDSQTTNQRGVIDSSRIGAVAIHGDGLLGSYLEGPSPIHKVVRVFRIPLHQIGQEDVGIDIELEIPMAQLSNEGTVYTQFCTIRFHLFWFTFIDALYKEFDPNGIGNDFVVHR
jgi:hypothetical protein